MIAPRIPRDIIKARRRPNERLRPKHLDFVRSLRICIACGAIGPVDVAHVRMSSAAHGKFNAMSAKPDGRYVLPLCPKCHRVDQHAKEGEPAFWARLGIDPLDASLRLHAVTGDYEQGLRCIERARQAIELHKNSLG